MLKLMINHCHQNVTEGAGTLILASPTSRTVRKKFLFLSNKDKTKPVIILPCWLPVRHSLQTIADSTIPSRQFLLEATCDASFTCQLARQNQESPGKSLRDPLSALGWRVGVSSRDCLNQANECEKTQSTAGSTIPYAGGPEPNKSREFKWRVSDQVSVNVLTSLYSWW